MKVLLVGGGTGGPVTPLLAVKKEISKIKPNAEFIYFGSKQEGPEWTLIKGENIRFYTIPAGKWRRYFSLKNFFDLFLTAVGFFWSLILLKKLKPTLLFAAGSFTSVPVAYADKILGIKIVIHQQDVLPSLSNKLIFPIADKVTVALEKSKRDFYYSSGLFKTRAKTKIYFTGNPIREEIFKGSVRTARKIFNLERNLPTLLVLGGGAGARNLNLIIDKALPELIRYFQIVHVTGQGRRLPQKTFPNYHSYEFLTEELPHAIKAADIVISRAGFSTLSELAVCKKVVIIVPLPQSHQLHNAYYFMQHNAALAVPEHQFTPERFVRMLRRLQFDREVQNVLKARIGKMMSKDGAKNIARILTSPRYQEAAAVKP